MTPPNQATFSDRELAELGRSICDQLALPCDRAERSSQAAVLEEWARRWPQAWDSLTSADLDLVHRLAAELRRA